MFVLCESTNFIKVDRNGQNEKEDDCDAKRQSVDLRHTPSTEGLCPTSFLWALAHLPARLSEATVVLFASLRFSHVYRESTVEEHPRGNMGPSFRHVWVVPKKVPYPEAGLEGQGALGVCATVSPFGSGLWDSFCEGEGLLQCVGQPFPCPRYTWSFLDCCPDSVSSSSSSFFFPALCNPGRLVFCLCPQAWESVVTLPYLCPR